MIQVPAGAIKPRVPRPLTQLEQARIQVRLEMTGVIRESIDHAVTPVIQAWRYSFTEAALQNLASQFVKPERIRSDKNDQARPNPYYEGTRGTVNWEAHSSHSLNKTRLSAKQARSKSKKG